MVKIINNDMYINTTGTMVGGKPSLYVLHNDAGAMSAEDYIAWLRSARTPGTSRAASGFAHYYIDRNAIVRVQNTTKIAWAMGNKWANDRALSYEVCQQLSANDKQWRENEDMVLRQMAEDMLFYGDKPTMDNIVLHNEYSSTSCPQRTKQLHGNNKQTRQYIIDRIKHFQSLGSTVQEMLAVETFETTAEAGEYITVYERPDHTSKVVENHKAGVNLRVLGWDYGAKKHGQDRIWIAVIGPGYDHSITYRGWVHRNFFTDQMLTEKLPRFKSTNWA